MWKIIIVFILFSIIAKFPVLAFHCYLDTTGSPPPKEGEPLLLDNFKVFDCNLMKSKDAKVRFFQIFDFFRYWYFVTALYDENWCQKWTDYKKLLSRAAKAWRLWNRRSWQYILLLLCWLLQWCKTRITNCRLCCYCVTLLFDLRNIICRFFLQNVNYLNVVKKTVVERLRECLKIVPLKEMRWRPNLYLKRLKPSFSLSSLEQVIILAKNIDLSILTLHQNSVLDWPMLINWKIASFVLYNWVEIEIH